ncbi:3-oxoacyl-ACP synthase III family protein [Actinoplanes sp. NBRC 101535]|uniref:3-oxoacyl-ACP synthase III family protein n=1 Tax=Actinoplanes sp. NBRC 101535 TaxID=3032196 RepID=UPI00249FA98A|nr:3-oxoacyl-ACP synthase III family protein [Actinoplanes sp. NBRC 101535]GLY07022.1 3-oxoacyl-ACP synthase III [Actinoplanes sp. NBRC 101535]
MTNVHVIGTGGYQPGDPIPTSEIERLVGPLPADVLEGLAITSRHWIADPATGAQSENNSDMALKAAQRALESAGVDAAEIDLMILATGTPDYVLPPVVNLVQERLGLVRCATMELRSGGAGVVQAMEIARRFLADGTYRTALLIGSEAISPVLIPVFLGQDPARIRMRERIPVYMFGDGAGALVMRAGEGPGGVSAGATACIGGDRKPGIHAVGGGTHAPIAEQLKAKRLVDLRVDVVGAGDFTPQMVIEGIGATLAAAKVDVETVDLCLVPEGNVGWMRDSLTDQGLDQGAWKALDGKVIDSLPVMGAVGCAAVPLFLDDAWRSGRIRRGDRVMVVGVESTKWIYAGAVIDWTMP